MEDSNIYEYIVYIFYYREGQLHHVGLAWGRNAILTKYIIIVHIYIYTHTHAYTPAIVNG